MTDTHPRSRLTAALWLAVPLLAALALHFAALLPRLATHLPGTPDDAALALWHTWWPLAGLASSDTLSFGPALNAYSGGPYLANHLGAMPLLQSLLFAPLRALTGSPIAAFNLVLMLMQALTHALTFACLRSKGAPPAAAGLGAGAFVLSAWYYAALTGADIITAALWPLPLALLLWDRLLDRPGIWRALLAALAVYAGVLSGVQHLAWVFNLWLPYAAWTGFQSVRREGEGDPAGRARLVDALLAAGVGLAILLLIYPGHNMMRTLMGNEPAFGSAAAVGVMAQPARSFAVNLLRTAPLIWAAAAAGFALGGQDERGARFWLVAGVGSLLFAFGALPDLSRMVIGALGLPFQPVYGIAIFFGVAAFALTVYACLALGRLAAVPRPVTWLAAGGLLLAMVAADYPALRGLPQHRVEAAPYYATIAADREDYFVLDYPFGLLGAQDGRATGSAAYLARAAVWHGKRTVSGVAAYYPPAHHALMEGYPFLFPERLTPDQMGAAAESLGRAVREWRIGYVVVHPDLLGEADRAAVDALAAESGALCPAVSRDGLLFYRARWHPAGCEGGGS